MIHTEALEAGIRLATAGFDVTIALRPGNRRHHGGQPYGEVTINPRTDDLDELVEARGKARAVLGDDYAVEQDSPGWLEVKRR